jgi:hypothetical protein
LAPLAGRGGKQNKAQKKQKRKQSPEKKGNMFVPLRSVPLRSVHLASFVYFVSILSGRRFCIVPTHSSQEVKEKGDYDKCFFLHGVSMPQLIFFLVVQMA